MTRNSKDKPDADTVTAGSDSSDKENSSKPLNSKRQRKVAKLRSSEDDETSGSAPAAMLKRKSEEGATGPAETAVPEKVCRVDNDEVAAEPAKVDEQTQTDRRPRVVIASGAGRKRIVGRLAAKQPPAINPPSSPVKDRPPPAKVVVDRPWRANMRPKSEERKEGEKPTTTEPKKASEKPWRVNMKPKDNNILATVQVLPKEGHDGEKKKEAERAWRTNMKPKPPAPATTAGVAVKKRHYDRDAVRKFMQAKKLRQKQAREEEERQELVRQALIKQRLNELDKLQKEIVETDFSGGNNARREENSGQEFLREKLIELTNEMKAKWMYKQAAARKESLIILKY